MTKREIPHLVAEDLNLAVASVDQGRRVSWVLIGVDLNV